MGLIKVVLGRWWPGWTPDDQDKTGALQLSRRISQHKEKKSTADVYRPGLKLFIHFFKERHGEDKTYSSFLDMLEENLRLPRSKKKKLAESELVDFIEFLKTKDFSNNSIRTYIAAVQNFLKYKDFVISQRWLGNLPKSISKKSNRKHRWKLNEIKEFTDKASTYRDTAVILVLFQSGISISDFVR